MDVVYGCAYADVGQVWVGVVVLVSVGGCGGVVVDLMKRKKMKMKMRSVVVGVDVGVGVVGDVGDVGVGGHVGFGVAVMVSVVVGL